MKEKTKKNFKQNLYPVLFAIGGYILAYYIGSFSENQSLVIAILSGIIYMSYEDLKEKIENNERKN